MKALILAIAVTLAAGPCLAQTYPTRPINVTVVTQAGAGSDLTMRSIGELLSRELQQSIVVDNRPGAGGALAAEYIARAAPDGYNLLAGTSSVMVMLPLTNSAIKYDPLRDFTPIGKVTKGHVVLVTASDQPFNSLGDVVKHAKANPGKMSYGSAGVGTTHHLVAELFSQEAGIDLVHAPYKGAPQATTDLLGGRLNLVVNNIGPALPQIRAGRVRALAVSSPQRVPELPDVPTMRELGYPRVEANTWVGLFGPRNLPPAVVQRLSAGLRKVMADQELVRKLAAAGNDIEVTGPEELTAHTKAEIELWRGVIKTRKLTFN